MLLPPAPQVPGTRGVVVIEATTEGARLVTPHLPALSTEPLHPQMLLRGAADLGLPLFMEDRDVPFAGVTLKVTAACGCVVNRRCRSRAPVCIVSALPAHVHVVDAR